MKDIDLFSIIHELECLESSLTVSVTALREGTENFKFTDETAAETLTSHIHHLHRLIEDFKEADKEDASTILVKISRRNIRKFYALVDHSGKKPSECAQDILNDGIRARHCGLFGSSL